MNKTGPNSGHFWSIQYLMLIFAQIAPILSMVEANEYILVVFSVMYHQGMPHQYQGISCRQGVYVLIWVTLLFMVRFQKFQVLLSSLWKSKNILTKLTNCSPSADYCFKPGGFVAENDEKENAGRSKSPPSRGERYFIAKLNFTHSKEK